MKKGKRVAGGKGNTYSALIARVFSKNYTKGADKVPFRRSDLVEAAKALGVKLPKNLGDVIYAMRYRTSLPDNVTKTQKDGKQWIIVGTGRASYAFRLSALPEIKPSPHLLAVKIPDSTPEIIGAYALSDEQALLAKVRYNRLLDVFLGVAAYSLQNHLRTTVKGVGQIEIDELYVAVDKRGRQYILPVQAKGGTDRLSVVQAEQDIACCREKFPHLTCRAISAQFMPGAVIALFELEGTPEGIKVVDERHYRLVAADQITAEELRAYDK